MGIAQIKAVWLWHWSAACSIEADQGGTPHARARVSLVSWEGRSHALSFIWLIIIETFTIIIIIQITYISNNNNNNDHMIMKFNI